MANQVVIHWSVVQQQVISAVSDATCERAVPDFREDEVPQTVEIIGVVLSGASDPVANG